MRQSAHLLKLSFLLLCIMFSQYLVAQMDLELHLEAEKPSLLEGEQGKFTFFVENTGTVDAADVVVVFRAGLLEADFVGMDAVSSHYFGELKAGEQARFEIEVISRSSFLRFYAEIVNGAWGDIDSNQDNIDPRCRGAAACQRGEDECIYNLCELEDDEVIYPQPNNLDILAYTCPPELPITARSLSYEITIRNNNDFPSYATNLNLFQNLIDVYGYENPPPHLMSRATVPSIAANATETLSLSFIYNPNSSSFYITADAYFEFSDNATSPGFSVDFACLKFTSDVAITAIAESPYFRDDEIMSYRIEVTNNGGEAVKKLKVLYAKEIEAYYNSFDGNVLSATTDFESSSFSEEFVYTDATYKYWNIEHLAVGETAVLSVRYQISGDIVEQYIDSYSINVSVSSDFLEDTDTSNNNASVEFKRVPIHFLDLELSVSSAKPDLSQWNSTPFIFTLQNTGTIDATGVAVDICYQQSMVLVGNSSPVLSVGNFKNAQDADCGQKGVWADINIAAGETATLQLELFATAPRPSFCAEVVSFDQESDLDSTPNNAECNDTSEDDELFFQADSPNIDLELSLETLNGALKMNEENKLVLYLYNNSPSIAHNVAVDVDLRQIMEMTDIRPIHSQGNYDANTARWTLGDVLPYIAARLELGILPTNELAYIYAQVSAAEETDADSTPDDGICCTGIEDDEAVLLSPLVCGNNFFDDGGPLAPYSDEAAVEVYTFCPDVPGERLILELLSLDLYSGDNIVIFDGDTTAQALITEVFYNYSASRLPLTLKPTNPSGCLTLRFENKGGNTTAEGWKIKLDCNCSPIYPFSVLEKSPYTATLTWEVESAYRVEYREEYSDTDEAYRYIEGFGSTLTLSDLMPATWYEARIAFQCEDGSYEAFEISTSFRTEGCTPDGFVTVEEVNPTTASLRLAFPTDYRLEYSKRYSNEDKFIEGSGAFLTLSDLLPASVYDLKITIPCEDGTYPEDSYFYFVFETPNTLVRLSCDDVFVDSGGPSENYNNNEDVLYVICPNEEGKVVRLDFSSFETASVYDIMRVNDGDGINNTRFLGSYSGIYGPTTITATNPRGCLAVHFVSDISTTRAGWEASISCVERGGGNLPNISFEIAQREAIQAFPNPTRDILQVKGNYTATTPYTIYDLLGKALQHGQLEDGILAVDRLPKGTYFLKVEATQVSAIRFVKL